MISAYDNFENVRAFFQQSGYDYILKPVNNDDMQIVLEGLSERIAKKHPFSDDMKNVLTENKGFNNLILYVNEHFTEKLTLDFLSDKFGFSKNYVCGLFQRYYNKSLTRYITELRMKHARELLADKSRLVKDVALDCGYREYFHFFKVFKSFYGMSPKEMQDLRDE